MLRSSHTLSHRLPVYTLLTPYMAQFHIENQKFPQRSANMYHTATDAIFCHTKALSIRVHHIHATYPYQTDLHIIFWNLRRHVMLTHITLAVWKFLPWVLLNSRYIMDRVSKHYICGIWMMVLNLNDITADVVNILKIFSSNIWFI